MVKIGAYLACLQDRSLREALAVIGEMGLTGAEVNTGGFIPAPHAHVDLLKVSAGAREEYLGVFAEAGIELTGLNVNGNPLHPDPEIRARHAEDLRDTIELGELLGVRRVVTMSGLPGTQPDARYPSWIVVPWDTLYLEARDAQWELAVPFWRDIEARAADAGVKVCIEMHPGMLVYNPPTLMRLIEAVGAEHVGAEMDPSHLFWQGIDPIAAIGYLGDRVFHAAAKDTRVNEEHCRVYGVLDDRLRRPAAGEAHIGLGGRALVSLPPADAAWQFVSVGRGHDVDYWTGFLRALAAVDPDMAVNIEHEDRELSQLDGLRVAADTLQRAAAAL